MKMNRMTTSLVASSVLLLAVGCGDGLSTAEGTVTIDGNPAAEGLSLQFTPVDGGAPSYGRTDSSGHYVAQFTFNRVGIETGEHSVKLVPGGGGADSGQMPVVGADGKVQAPANPAANLPAEYYEEIQRVTIEPGSNQVDLALETQG